MFFDGVLEEYIGPGGDVVIPASLGVTEIAADSIRLNKDITSIVIPEGVEVIGLRAFYECENLTSITLPYSLYELGQECFNSCNLTSILIPPQAPDAPAEAAPAEEAVVEEAPVDETPAE